MRKASAAGPVAVDLAIDRGTAGDGVLEPFEDQDAGPFAEHEAVAIAVERARGPLGSSLCRLRAVSRLRPVTPNGWIRLCVPPAIMMSASPRRMISADSPIAWPLAAQAVKELKFGPWASNRQARWLAAMCGSRSFSAAGSSNSMPARANSARSNWPPRQRAIHHPGELAEILIHVAGAQIDAQPRGVADDVGQAGVGEGLFGGPDGEQRLPRMMDPAIGRVLAGVGDRPVADLGGDPGGEVDRVEERRAADARFTAEQAMPKLLGCIAQRSDAAQSGDDHARSHVRCSVRIARRKNAEIVGKPATAGRRGCRAKCALPRGADRPALAEQLACRRGG